MEAPVVPAVKLVITGDANVGKTCAIISYTYNKFPDEYIPTVFDNYTTDIVVDGELTRLGFWDTAGQDYARLRPLSYPNTDVLIVMYSVSARRTLQNVADKWEPELTFHCPNVPIVVVGNKIDLRTENADVTTTAEGQNMADRIGAAAFVECSALTQEGLSEVFETCVKRAREGGPGKKKGGRKGDPVPCSVQ